MKLLNVALALGFLTATAGMAQGPLNDRIIVKMPYAMNVNGTVLQPGEYEIKQHDSVAGGSRILLFYSDKGMKFETTAMAIPALDNKTPEKTELMLNQYGNDYYLNKIWVQGKNYGYEFPIPDSIKSREREIRASTVFAKYESTPQTASTPPVTQPATTETAEAAPPTPPRVDAAPTPARRGADTAVRPGRDRAKYASARSPGFGSVCFPDDVSARHGAHAVHRVELARLCSSRSGVPWSWILLKALCNCLSDNETHLIPCADSCRSCSGGLRTKFDIRNPPRRESGRSRMGP